MQLVVEFLGRAGPLAPLKSVAVLFFTGRKEDFDTKMDRVNGAYKRI